MRHNSAINIRLQMMQIKLTLYKEFIMSRSSKIFIGFLSFLPIVLSVVLFITMFFQFFNLAQLENQDAETREAFWIFGPFFMIVMILFLLSIGLLVYFIIHIARNKKADSTERAIWILAIVLGGIVTYPIYWYMKIWKEDL
jgi:heme/copper-type cytochrome/quinol oxidase subunit 2